MDGIDDPDSWLHLARSEVAAADRSRRYWLEQQAREGATVCGVLLDAAERRARGFLATRTGTTWRGEIVAVSGGLVAIGLDSGATALVLLDAVATVRLEGGGHAYGDRRASFGHDIHTALANALVDRPRVQLVTGRADPVVGELRVMGDELAVVLDDSGTVVLVALDSIEAAVLL